MLDHFCDANIYQTWAYGTERWGEKNVSHLLLKCGGETVAMAQLRVIQFPVLRAGIAYLRWGPLCHRKGSNLDSEVLQAMVNALREEYVTKRGLYLEVLPNAFGGTPRASVFQSVFCDFNHKPTIGNERYRTLVLDLAPPLDELRKNLDKKWRNQLNAAMRNGLDIISGDSCDLYSQFCELYKQMWNRKKFDSGVSIDEFLRIQQRLPEGQRLQVLICRHQGKPVAGVVCSSLGDSAIYLLGATNEDGMKLKASYALQWAVIQALKENGILSYDLGGIDPIANPGVHHFKIGLSGVDVSHLDSLSMCRRSLSAGLVKAGQFLRGHLRPVQKDASAVRLAEATIKSASETPTQVGG